MGAWEAGSFGNDDALDWVWELEKSSGTKLLVQACAAIENNDYPESPDCSIALVAAETVAAAKGHPAKDFPDTLHNWLKKQKDAEAIRGLAMRAGEALRKLQAKSELRELWEESDSWEEWQQGVNNLLQRLTA